MNRKLLLLLCLFAFSCVKAQDDDYYKPDHFVYSDRIYSESIRTVQLYEKSWELSPAVIRLNTEDRLKLGFDDLSNELKNIYYTVIHCNADWEPSDVSPSEYIDGYREDIIAEYSHSFNTLQKYIHYNLVFPTEVLKITKSGNYLLKVYQDNDPDKVLFGRRFLVVDDQVEIVPSIKQATLTRYRLTRQEIDFTINVSNLKLLDPYSDLKVVIQQNDRWDNAKTGLRPMYINDTQLIYDHDEENTFNGGNEFRFFDIKTLRFQGERVNDIMITKDTNIVYLTTEESRPAKRYFSQTDINGKYVVRVQEGRNPENDADYARVRFVLPSDNQLTKGNFYIFGQLSDWTCKKEFKLVYDETKHAYLANPYLKQGYYNYQIVYLEDGKKIADESLMEGSHSEAENDYTILVYYRGMGRNFDQLVGMQKINSLRKY